MWAVTIGTHPDMTLDGARTLNKLTTEVFFSLLSMHPRLDKTPSGRKVTFDSWAYGERETQTVSTYITDSDPSPTTSQLPYALHPS